MNKDEPFENNMDPTDKTPEKVFNFLDYIKNPGKSDEKKIELHDYLFIRNNENPVNSPQIIEKSPILSLQEAKQYKPFSKSLDNIAEYTSHDYRQDMEISYRSLEDLRKLSIEEEEKAVCWNEEELKKKENFEEEEKKPYIDNNAYDNEYLFPYENYDINAINSKNEENIKKNQEKEEIAENIENNRENQPKFIYGHALEDIIYNVNSLRGQLNQLKMVSEHAGIDTAYLQNIDQSFSMALNGIQQKFQDTENNLRNFELSEEVLKQMLSDLNNQSQNNSSENKIPINNNKKTRRFYVYWQNFKNFIFFIIMTMKIIFERIYMTLKNPENLFKILVLVVSMVFYSGLRQIPTLKYYGEIFDWLAYDKNSKTLLFVLNFNNFIYNFFSLEQLSIYYSLGSYSKPYGNIS